MDYSRRFAKLVLGHIRKHGDVSEHDAAGTLLAELEDLDNKSPEVAAPPTDEVPAQGESGTEEDGEDPDPDLTEIDQEPAPEPASEPDQAPTE